MIDGASQILSAMEQYAKEGSGHGKVATQGMGGHIYNHTVIAMIKKTVLFAYYSHSHTYIVLL